MNKIGILGSGTVAQSLGKGLLSIGYEVKLGTSNPGKLNAWLEGDGNGASVGSFKEAAAFGELIVLSVKAFAAKEILEQIGQQHISSKTIIDATNPISENEPPVNGVLHFFSQINKSFMEELQEAYPKASFVKAFNSVGSHFMVNPPFEVKPSMFIAGNNEAAKKQVSEIIEKFGWEVEDMGMAEAARAIEPLCMLWCIPGFRDNQWTHAFKLLKV